MTSIFGIMSQEQKDKEKVALRRQKMEEQEKKKKKKSVFDYVNQINMKTSALPFNDKLCSGYMLMLNYSLDENLLPIVNKLNTYLFNMKNKQVYDYFYDKVPKGRRYNRWPKKSKEDKKKEALVEQYMQEFNISRREALKFV